MRIVIAVLCLLLAGCSFAQWNEKLSTPEERALALEAIAAIRSGNVDSLKTKMDPKTFADTAKAEASVKPMLPATGTPSLVTVHSSMLYGGTPQTIKMLNYEFGSGGTWVVMQVMLKEQAGSTQIVGWHATPMAVEPTQAGAFSLSGKPAQNYLWIAAMIASTGTILTALVLAFRSKGIKRRWLWVIGSLIGLGQFSLNWSTGGWGIRPIGFNILGSAFLKASPFDPWILTFSLPIVAVVFIALRPRLIEKVATDNFD